MILMSHQVTALKASSDRMAMITALNAPGSIGAEVISISLDKPGKYRNRKKAEKISRCSFLKIFCGIRKLMSWFIIVLL